MRNVRQAKDRQGSYGGQYVALDPATGNKVIASGPKSQRVAAEARRAGVKVPIIVYVPEKDSAYLF